MRILKSYIDFDSLIYIQGDGDTKEVLSKQYADALKSIVIRAMVSETIYTKEERLVRSIFAIRGEDTYYYVIHEHVTPTSEYESRITDIALYPCSTRTGAVAAFTASVPIS